MNRTRAQRIGISAGEPDRESLNSHRTCDPARRPPRRPQWKDSCFPAPRRVTRAFGAAALLVLVIATASALAQSESPARSIVKADPVEYLYPEQITIPSGKSSPVALHFRVAPGLHINSHTPREEFLIPSTFSIPEASGVRLEAADYPSGIDFTLPLDPGEKLSVYTGEFTIQARIIASPGDHLVEAKLRYQACNSTQCLPPRTIAVPIDVVGK